MRVRPFLVFLLILALTSATLAQDAGSPDPQPVPVPNYVVPTGSDPNDSGYTSPILLNYDWTLADPAEDNASLRLEANRQRRSGNPDFIGDAYWRARIAKSATIDTSAQLRGLTVIGPDCYIGAGALLQDTIVWPGAQIASLSELQGCIVRTRKRAEGILQNAIV